MQGEAQRSGGRKKVIHWNLIGRIYSQREGLELPALIGCSEGDMPAAVGGREDAFAGQLSSSIQTLLWNAMPGQRTYCKHGKECQGLTQRVQLKEPAYEECHGSDQPPRHRAKNNLQGKSKPTVPHLAPMRHLIKAELAGYIAPQAIAPQPQPWLAWPASSS